MLEKLSGLTGSPIHHGLTLTPGSAKEGTSHVIGPEHDQPEESRGVKESLKGHEAVDGPYVPHRKRPLAPTKLLRARMTSVWELAAKRAQRTSELVAKSRARRLSGISPAPGLLAPTRQSTALHSSIDMPKNKCQHSQESLSVICKMDQDHQLTPSYQPHHTPMLESPDRLPPPPLHTIHTPAYIPIKDLSRSTSDRPWTGRRRGSPTLSSPQRMGQLPSQSWCPAGGQVLQQLQTGPYTHQRHRPREEEESAQHDHHQGGAEISNSTAMLVSKQDRAASHVPAMVNLKPLKRQLFPSQRQPNGPKGKTIYHQQGRECKPVAKAEEAVMMHEGDGKDNAASDGVAAMRMPSRAIITDPLARLLSPTRASDLKRHERKGGPWQPERRWQMSQDGVWRAMNQRKAVGGRRRKKSGARTTPLVSAAVASGDDGEHNNRGRAPTESRELPAHSTDKIRAHIQAVRAQLRDAKDPAADPQSETVGFALHIGPPLRNHRTIEAVSLTNQQQARIGHRSPSTSIVPFVLEGTSVVDSDMNPNPMIENSFPAGPHAGRYSRMSLPHRGPPAEDSDRSLASVRWQRVPAPSSPGLPGVDQVRHLRQLALVSALSAAIAFGMAAAAGRPSTMS